MHSDQFKEANKMLGAGGNPNTRDLPVAISTEPGTGHQVPFIISRWKLSPQEVDLIKERGELWIAVMGPTQPPFLPMAYHPFREGGFKALDPEKLDP